MTSSKKFRFPSSKFSSAKSAADTSKAKKTAVAHLKAAKLRKYARLCKAEGIDSNRVNVGPKLTTDSHQRHKQKEQKKIVQPFFKEINEAKKFEQQLQMNATERSQADASLQAKLKEREKRKKALLRQFQSKKPNIGSQANKLLGKITASLANNEH
jgi:hypothetical protein